MNKITMNRINRLVNSTKFFIKLIILKIIKIIIVSSLYSVANSKQLITSNKYNLYLPSLHHLSKTFFLRIRYVLTLKYISYDPVPLSPINSSSIRENYHDKHKKRVHSLSCIKPQTMGRVNIRKLV